MPLQEFQTKIKTVKAVQWDGSDAVYDTVAPIIGRSIRSYTKLNGSDTGALTIKVNSAELMTVPLGSYIVITNEGLGQFTIMDEASFNNKYEPVKGGSGLLPSDDDEEEVISPSTASETLKI